MLEFSGEKTRNIMFNLTQDNNNNIFNFNIFKVPTERKTHASVYLGYVIYNSSSYSLILDASYGEFAFNAKPLKFMIKK